MKMEVFLIHVGAFTVRAKKACDIIHHSYLLSLSARKMLC